MARRTAAFHTKHEKMMRMIKRIILLFYGMNLLNATFIYIPHRIDVSNDNNIYSMTPCVGLDPLTSPKREICMTILFIQELTIMTVALNFQALLLLLIPHTAVMYQMLADEMLMLNADGNETEIKKLAKDSLPTLIYRHSLTLDVIDKLKSLYSVPLGVNFGSNAVCMSLFFYLPLQEWLQFIPILVYCFLVFFLYCFLCQRVINASEIFESSVYCCGWENFDLKEKKLVYVMLRQAQKPIQLLAADIIPVNIYTFATTLQAMFKFVTVVKI
ncbi:odorant receptor 22b-like [Anticarsia gemmatalis]|uniref:odorant receptor 22b-like n=1 Tax=Anticarsia gemmatalis TaxID=129554 RepID=UPI003F759084